jgi:acyl-CoA synthetase (AMP-forming)/AMP-acid ligase II
MRIVAEDVPRAGQPISEPVARLLPGDPASIVFTSGSTGPSKGVVQSHGNLLRGCRAVAGYLGYVDTDVILCPVPWSFDYGFGQLLSTLVLGVTQVIPTAFNPFGICEALERDRPSVLAGVPSLFVYLMGGLSPIRTADRSSLRLLTNTGGSIPRPALEAMLDTFDAATIVLNYGLTESYRSCYLPPERIREVRGAIGIPIPGVDIAILREDDTLAAIGEEGQIVHRGDYVCLGYWNNADATARAIRSDPLAPRDALDRGRVLYTGDYGYRGDDGLFYFKGRRDHLLKSMGVRVSPNEVETLLCDSRLIAEAAVFGMPHELLGHEIWAAVVPNAASEDTLRELGRYARRTMTQPMQPRRYLARESLPRTSTGKVDYPALRQEAERLERQEAERLPSSTPA